MTIDRTDRDQDLAPHHTDTDALLLRHANLKLAALRAENAIMKENIRQLMRDLDRLTRSANMGAFLESVA